MTSFNISCGKCKTASDIDAWTKGQPKETYKCPACGFTFRRTIGPAQVLKSGFIYPGKIELQEVLK